MRFSGAMPSWLTSPDGAALGALGRRLGAVLLADFLAPSFLSVYFFLTPTALPDALTFFGPW